VNVKLFEWREKKSVPNAATTKHKFFKQESVFSTFHMAMNECQQTQFHGNQISLLIARQMPKSQEQER